MNDTQFVPTLSAHMHLYNDEEAVAVHICQSGFVDKYIVIEEDPTQMDASLMTVAQIYAKYGVQV